MEEQAEQYNQGTQGKKRSREEATVKRVTLSEDHESPGGFTVVEVEIPEDSPALKREKPAATSQELAYQDYLSRFEDLKLFIRRRMPPDNETAMNYIQEMEKAHPDEFLQYLEGTVMTIYKMCGLGLLFGRICAKCEIAEEDFVDRSVERPDLDTPEKRAKQLSLEKVDLQSQIRYILDLIPKMKE